MTTTWRLGGGAVALDDHGAPTAYVHDQLPTNRFLLSQATDSWHTADRCWGAGFVITDHGAAQWAVPDSSSVNPERAAQRFGLTDRLRLDVQRIAGDQLVETYRWTNTGDDQLQIGSLALSTPWRDVYEARGRAHETAVHAHISATGAQAWVLARPMHGGGPLLGLIVRQGVISAYSSKRGTSSPAPMSADTCFSMSPTTLAIQTPSVVNQCYACLPVRLTS